MHFSVLSATDRIVPDADIKDIEAFFTARRTPLAVTSKFSMALSSVFRRTSAE